MSEKYNIHPKAARKACHRKCVNARMKPDQDPDDLFFVQDECRQLSKAFGRRFTTSGTKALIFRAFLAEYWKGLFTSGEKRGFGLGGIRHMVHTISSTIC